MPPPQASSLPLSLNDKETLLKEQASRDGNFLILAMARPGPGDLADRLRGVEIAEDLAG
jgi:hypothetical protein